MQFGTQETLQPSALSPQPSLYYIVAQTAHVLLKMCAHSCGVSGELLTVNIFVFTCCCLECVHILSPFCVLQKTVSQKQYHEGLVLPRAAGRGHREGCWMLDGHF